MDNLVVIEVILTISGGVVSTFVGMLLKELSRLRESVEILNKNVAVIVERVGSHETRIAKLEQDR